MEKIYVILATFIILAVGISVAYLFFKLGRETREPKKS